MSLDKSPPCPQFWGSQTGRGRGKQCPYGFFSDTPRIGGGGAILFLLLLVCIPLHAAVPTVVPADAPTIKKAIAAQKGRVVLVNFWATWCAPCVAEFPAIVRVSRRYKRRGLSVIAVSADSGRDRQTRVQPFLVKQRVAFPVYLERSADPEDFIDAFDPTWPGDLPRTFIYDRRGKRVRTLTGEQTVRSLAAAVKPFLKH